MVQMIIGNKGKGKTVELLSKVNSEVQNATGNVVFLDKNGRHMYELNNKVRLIDVSTYPIKGPEEFFGFICGIVSQDHDLELLYLDSFLPITGCEPDNIEVLVKKIDALGTANNITITISCSVTEDMLSDELKKKVILSL